MASVLADARARSDAGDLRGAIALLSEANRAARHADLERSLVALRRAGGAAVELGAGGRVPAVEAQPSDGRVVEVDAADLSVDAVREGFGRCGCLLVRGLLLPEHAAALASGIDAALHEHDRAGAGHEPDRAWYDPGPMPDRDGSGLPEDVHRAFLRSRGSLWTLDSPRLLFEVLDAFDTTGLGRLMTELLGERPLLSGLKATLRRMPPDADVDGRWHQDGAFLGEEVAAFNCWMALSDCGEDAPSLDLVPARLPGVVSNEGARFDWSVADATVEEAAVDAGVVRPVFAAGDALLFDQLLLHRTGASPGMTEVRYAIESWFFAPSAYPAGQLPVLY